VRYGLNLYIYGTHYTNKLENIGHLNLAAVKLTTVQVTKLPL
jgi:hypothetical protein